MVNNVATYVGRRSHGSNKLASAFLFNGEEIYFQSVKGVEIGENYRLEIEGETVRIKARPELVEGSEATEEQREAWRLEDRKARESVARSRSVAKSNESRAIEAVSRALRPYVGNLSFRQLTDIVELAIEDATKERRERETREMNKRLAKVAKRFARSKGK